MSVDRRHSPGFARPRAPALDMSMCACALLFTSTLMLSSSARASGDGDARAAAGGTVALLPLLGSNLALDELAAVDATVQRAVDAWYGARSIPGATVRERLDEGARRGLRCDRSVESCQAQLGIVCDTDLVLVAALAPMTTSTDANGTNGTSGTSGPGGASSASGASSHLTLSLRLVDVADAAQLAFAEQTLPGLPSADDVRALLAVLDTPDARKALLHVAGPAGAAVSVDGKALDPLPWAVPVELPRGRHDVVVHTSPLFRTQVTLRRGERVHVAAPRNPQVGPLASTATPLTGEPLSAEPMPSMGGPSSKMLALAGGGALTGLGALTAAVGVAPWFAYNAAGRQLQEKEDDFLDDEDYLQKGENLADLQAVRREYDNNRAGWQSYGQIAFASGIAATVVGVTILGVGLLALE